MSVFRDETHAYLEWADRNYHTYKAIIDDIFNHTATIHRSIKRTIQCYEQFIAQHKEAFRTGIVLEFKEGCLDDQ